MGSEHPCGQKNPNGCVMTLVLNIWPIDLALVSYEINRTDDKDMKYMSVLVHVSFEQG